MSCQNCSSSGKTPGGCKNNGTCSANSCNKLTVVDWLSDIEVPSAFPRLACVEVRFKNGRKLFFKHSKQLKLKIGDVVATEASPGHDVGIVTLVGELVKVQMRKHKVDQIEQLPKIYRIASQKDIDIWQTSRDKEEKVKVRARELALTLDLEMKISDVEFQGDGSKATFYYTASERVDFRQLIKDYARTFNIRIEMKQVGFRQEAARLGGIGSCGRELCCSTWLTDFRSVNTTAARYQQLSLNPLKLAGQCGKLKCCLNYELDAYLEVLEKFPDIDTKIITKKGAAVCQKIDIFKELMWFAYENEPTQWHLLAVDQVNELLEQKQEISAIEEYGIELESTVESIDKESVFQNVVGQDSLTRFDKPKKRRKTKRPNRKPAQNQQKQEQPSRQGNKNQQQSNTSQQSKNQLSKKQSSRRHQKPKGQQHSRNTPNQNKELQRSKPKKTQQRNNKNKTSTIKGKNHATAKKSEKQ